MDSNNLGGKLKEARVGKKLTLQQLSNVSGVHTSHIGRIERGERFPSARVLKKLAAPLGFSETELLKLAGFMSQDESDERLGRLKKEIKQEILHALVTLYNKLDSL